MNGILLPFVPIFMVIPINKVKPMKEWVNSPLYNLVARVTVGSVSAACANLQIEWTIKSSRNEWTAH